MNKLKSLLPHREYLQFSVFIWFTVISLYLLYLLISHFREILGGMLSFMGSVLSAFSPLFLGLILAYLLSPSVNRLYGYLAKKRLLESSKESPKAKKKADLWHTLSILFVFLFIAATAFLLLYLFTVMVVGRMAFYSPRKMIEQLLLYFSEYSRIFSDMLSGLSALDYDNRVQEFVNNMSRLFSKLFNPMDIMNFAATLGANILKGFLGVVVAFYLLKDQEFFLRLFRKLLHLFLPMKQNAVFMDFLRETDAILSRFLRGQLLDGLLMGVLSSLGLTLIGLDFSVIIGCFAGIANIIPYFGPLLGMIPAGIVGLLMGDPQKALYALLLLFVIQQVDGALIAPKIVGESMGLHPVFVLIAVTAGGSYFGILGMLLAVPLTAICKLFLLRKLQEYPRRKNP